MPVLHAPPTRRELEEKFDALFLEYGPKVCSFAFRVTGDREAAKDIRQNTFLALHRNMHTLFHFDQKAIQAWIYRTAVNFVQHYWREYSKHTGPVASLETLPETAASPPPGSRDDFIAFLPEYLSDLDKEMLAYYYFDGLDLHEISVQCGLTYGSTRTHMSRLMARLRDGTPEDFHWS